MEKSNYLTESQFIEQNHKQWKELEALLERQTKDADRLHNLFVKVSSDLSYARTFYPNRSVRLYLNNLTQRVLDSMRTTEDKFSFQKIVNFFAHILPSEIYKSRKAFLVSLSVFLIALGIGIISSAHNDEFPTIILGESYIAETENNINNGDPMAIYKDDDKVGMTLRITTNNIKVSFLAFVLGLLGSVGTIFVLMSNGIMVGAFQYYFFSKGLFLTSFLTIWIHGTIEISAIIVAGAAGIVLGNGLLFPKTYKRTTALQVSALRALRILLGTVPLFIIAGLLESFVTRQTHLPTVVKAGIIFLSFIFILVMFVIYPWYHNKYIQKDYHNFDIIPNHTDAYSINRHSFRSLSQIFSDSFFEFRKYFGANLSQILLPSLAMLTISLWIFIKFNITDIPFDEKFISFYKLKHGSPIFVFTLWVLVSLAICFLKITMAEGVKSGLEKLKFIKQYYPKISLAVLLLYLPYAIIPNNFSWIAYLIIPPHFFVLLIEKITGEARFKNYSIYDLYSISMRNWPQFLVIYVVLLFIFWMSIILINSPVTGVVIDFIKWHDIFENFRAENLFVSHLMHWIMFCIVFPLSYYLISNELYSIDCKLTSFDLNERLKKFGKDALVFEKE